MKTTRTTNFLNVNHYLRLWSENGLSELRSHWLSVWRSVLSTCAQTRQQIHLYATLGWIAGNEVYSNDRKCAGAVLLMVSLITWWAHLFFDYNTVIPGWYYKNWFFWFFTNREELTVGIGLIGFFLMCPLKWGYKYLLTPIIIYCFSEVVYQSLQISHWTHFYRSMFSVERGWQLALFIHALIVSGVKVIDYVAYTKFHLKDGNTARVHGIIKAPGIDSETKMRHLEQLVKESENLNARI